MLDPKCDGNSHFSNLKDTYNIRIQIRFYFLKRYQEA